jgi:hypothetical protein
LLLQILWTASASLLPWIIIWYWKEIWSLKSIRTVWGVIRHEKNPQPWSKDSDIHLFIVILESSFSLVEMQFEFPKCPSPDPASLVNSFWSRYSSCYFHPGGSLYLRYLLKSCLLCDLSWNHQSLRFISQNFVAN